jgi:hypothetical protein
MAKATGPLFSVSASGQIKHRLTFSNKRVGNIVRFQHKNKDAQTARQIANRTRYAGACASWKLLDSGTKESWNLLAKGKATTGFNLYLKSLITGSALKQITMVSARLVTNSGECYIEVQLVPTDFTELYDVAQRLVVYSVGTQDSMTPDDYGFEAGYKVWAHYTSPCDETFGVCIENRTGTIEFGYEITDPPCLIFS